MSSWQTKASCPVSTSSAFFILPHRAVLILGTAGALCGTSCLLRPTAQSFQRLQRCGDPWCCAFITQTVMALLKLESGEMLSLHHPKFQLQSSPSQRSLIRTSKSSSSRGVTELCTRQGQRISCAPVKARNLCDRTRERMRRELPWPQRTHQPLEEWDIPDVCPGRIPQGRAVSAHLRPWRAPCCSDRCVPPLTPSPAHLAFQLKDKPQDNITMKPFCTRKSEPKKPVNENHPLLHLQVHHESCSTTGERMLGAQPCSVEHSILT